MEDEDDSFSNIPITEQDIAERKYGDYKLVEIKPIRFPGNVIVPRLSSLIESSHEEYALVTEQEIELEEETNCPLCNVTMNGVFMTLHELVHRGCAKVDQSVWNIHLCHLCGKLERTKADLYTHWRETCTEVLAYTQYPLEDQELASKVFFLVQLSVPESFIWEMVKLETDLRHEISDAEQAKLGLETKKSMAYMVNTINPIPEEKYNYAKSHPINHIIGSSCMRKRINMYSDCCASHFSTDMEWVIFEHPETKDVKRILGYQNTDSVMDEYIFNDRTEPKFNQDALGIQFDFEHFECEQCGSTLSTKGRLELHVKKCHCCPYCLLPKGATLSTTLTHYQFECPHIQRVARESISGSNQAEAMREQIGSLIFKDVCFNPYEFETQLLEYRMNHSDAHKIKPENTLMNRITRLRREKEQAIPIERRVKCLMCGDIVDSNLMAEHLVSRHGFPASKKKEMREILARVDLRLPQIRIELMKLRYEHHHPESVQNE